MTLTLIDWLIVAVTLVCVGLALLASVFHARGNVVYPVWVYILAFICAPAFACAGIASLVPKSVPRAIVAGIVGWLFGFFLGFPLFAICAFILRR